MPEKGSTLTGFWRGVCRIAEPVLRDASNSSRPMSFRLLPEVVKRLMNLIIYFAELFEFATGDEGLRPGFWLRHFQQKTTL